MIDILDHPIIVVFTCTFQTRQQSIVQHEKKIKNLNVKKNELPPHTKNKWTLKRPWHVVMDIKVLAWDRHQNVAGLNLLLGSLSLTIRSPMTTDINKQTKWKRQQPK